MKTLKVLAAIAILGVIVFLLFIYSGVYNVAATEPHIGFTYWVFNTTMKNSVQSRADEIKVPPLLDPSLMKKGFMHYRETCITCHGAPGVKPSEIGKGLMPEAPDLAKSAEKWTPAELYWIIKHGIKMTGMPEWGSGPYGRGVVGARSFRKAPSRVIARTVSDNGTRGWRERPKSQGRTESLR